MERRKLEAEEITKSLKGLTGWTLDGGRISRRYEFENFAHALEFVNRVGKIAEEADHHPDITFGWGYAEIAFTTHDRGGVTDVDMSLASQVNRL